MIFEAIVYVFMSPISFLVNMLPTPILAKISDFVIPQIVKHGAYFFPLDCLVLAIGSFLTWNAIFVSWATIEWLYKKIPGVD